jgi:transposase
MSQNNTHILYVGLDVAKLSLQLHLAGCFHLLANDAKGHAQLLKRLRGHPNAHVVCEATGGYEQAVVRALQAAGVPVSIVEAGRVRYFARAQGQRAKTDPIDAAVLSAYGTTFQPAATAPASVQQQQLAELGTAPPPAHPAARQRTQPRRALHRFIPAPPVPATRQSPGKTNHSM